MTKYSLLATAMIALLVATPAYAQLGSDGASREKPKQITKGGEEEKRGSEDASSSGLHVNSSAMKAAPNRPMASDTGGKSMNPNTGVAGFKKELQDAKDQKRAADIAEGSKQVAKEGKQAGTQLGGIKKPESPMEKSASDSMQQRDEAKKKHSMCNLQCMAYKASSTGSNIPKPLSPKWGSSDDDSKEKTPEPTKEEIAAKKQASYDACMSACMNKNP